MKRKADSDVGYFVISILILIAVYLIMHYMPHQSREVTVIDCYPVENYYEVVVEDSNGEQWAYFSDHYTDTGVVNVLFKGDEIIDAR